MREKKPKLYRMKDIEYALTTDLTALNRIMEEATEQDLKELGYEKVKHVTCIQEGQDCYFSVEKMPITITEMRKLGWVKASCAQDLAHTREPTRCTKCCKLAHGCPGNCLNANAICFDFVPRHEAKVILCSGKQGKIERSETPEGRKVVKQE